MCGQIIERREEELRTEDNEERSGRLAATCEEAEQRSTVRKPSNQDLEG